MRTVYGKINDGERFCDYTKRNREREDKETMARTDAPDDPLLLPPFQHLMVTHKHRQ